MSRGWDIPRPRRGGFGMHGAPSPRQVWRRVRILSVRGLGPDGENGMSPDLRDSRATLILLAASVAAVLIFGAFTLLMQIG